MRGAPTGWALCGEFSLCARVLMNLCDHIANGTFLLQDLFVLFVGALGAFGTGVTWPVWSLLFSSSINGFAGNGDVVSAVTTICLGFLYLGAGIGACTGTRV